MKTIQVYSFEELSEEVKQRVIEYNRNIYAEYDWWHCELDNFSELGIIIEGFDLYHRTIKIKNKYDWSEVASNICSQYGGNAIAELSKQFSTNAEYEKELSEAILSFLDEEHEYITSDDFVAEYLQDNEYEFTKNGTMIWND